mmetsp:Transcript_35932/g.78357  ORF Transcript_35932/g.78357 Transcript_35932/m.78357 type:complete len:307 (+) Transcript_35932:94-1014(+)
MSLSWPTAKVKAAFTTAAGIFRFFAGSRSNQPRSPAKSPPRKAVSHSEFALHRVVKADDPPAASCGSMPSNSISASPTVLVAFTLLRSPTGAWEPTCLSIMCRHRTFLRPVASLRARFGAGSSESPRADQENRTAAATRGAWAPPFRASSSTLRQAARGRSTATWDRTNARSRLNDIPAFRTPPTVRSTPKWLCSRMTQCVEGSEPSPMTSRFSIPPSMPAWPKIMQAAPHVATKARRPPSNNAAATATPSSAPTSLANSWMDSESASTNRSFCHLPRYAARHGNNLTCRPLAAASATAPPLAWAS